MATGNRITTQDKLSLKENKKFNFAFATPPLSAYGKVNIDNIPDREYELIQEILQSTFNRKIHWKSQSFISIVTHLMTNKQIELIYNGSYKGMKIALTSNVKGKISIKVTKGLTNKVIVDTFIPDKPVIQLGRRQGTSRAMQLFSLYRAVRYQVDGELLAS